MVECGKFLTIEGTEGVGKSTNVDFIRDYFKEHEIPLLVTREPGGTPLAEQIRDLLLQQREEAVDPTTELLLVFAARSQHVQSVILPALQRGCWVLSDRFTDATYAYQGGGRGLDTSIISVLERQLQHNVQPDLTLLLDIDVAEGLSRAGQRGELDRFEHEQLDFFERVRSAYHQRVKDNPKRYSIIDAGDNLLKVQASIKKTLDQFIAEIRSQMLTGSEE